MMLFVIAMVDPAARARLTRLRELAAPFGILPRDVHGHITLAAYAGGEEGRFISSAMMGLNCLPLRPPLWRPRERRGRWTPSSERSPELGRRI